MIFVISGDRYADISAKQLIIHTLIDLSPEIVYFGECRGIDMLAKKVCKENNIKYKIFEADWEKYGNAAGPIRNKLMIDAACMFKLDRFIRIFPNQEELKI